MTARRPLSIALAALFLLLWAINLVWTLSLSAQYGGSALDGGVRNGQYYLAQRGTSTPVSQAIWSQIRIHELVFRFGALFAFLCFGYLLFILAVPTIMELRQGEGVNERVQAVRASGPRLAAKTCAGTIGRAGSPFLFVEVFPGGVTVRLIFQEPVAIRKEEVRTIFPELGRYVIAHTSPDIASPVILSFVKGTALAEALDQLRPDQGEGMRGVM
jgi:hypothetical protein